jgi:hypothetical protein
MPALCLPPAHTTRTKQIIAGSPEKLQHAQHEVAVLQALSHANCLPLLGHSVNPISDSGGRAHEVLLVLPAYEVCVCRGARRETSLCVDTQSVHGQWWHNDWRRTPATRFTRQHDHDQTTCGCRTARCLMSWTGWR